MALTEEQMREFGERLVPLYQELEQNVISDIALRVKKTGRYTETAEIMVKSLMELGYSPAKIQSEVMKLLRADNAYKMAVAENTKAYKEYVSSEIARVTATAREEGNTIVAEAGNMAFNNDLSLWEQTGKSLSEPGGLRQLIDAMALQTNGELRNLTKSMGFKGMGFTAVENVYQHQLDIGLIKLTSGAYSWEQVVNDCVHELAQSGLRSIDYKSGRTMQLDTAVRNCIMTASSQLAGKVTMLNMETTGETLVEVSQHWGARSDGTRGHGDHAYWQGKVYAVDKGSHKSECRRLGYAIRNLEEATGYPSDPKGLHGYNCRHTMYPFFEGISEPNQWKPEPEPVTVNGKEYTYYQATQKQRQMERQIRATKREIEAQKTLGGDTKDLRNKLRKQTADYKKFSADVDIRPKNERLRVQGGTSDLNKNSKKYYKRDRSGERVIRKGKTRDKVGVTYEISGMREDSQERIRSLFDCLTKEYNSPLKSVKRGSVGNGIKASTDILGEVIELNASEYTTLAHEFFHTLANTKRDKAGLSDDSAFWKEIKSIRRKYNDAVAKGTTKAITSYAGQSVDEFGAECFAQYMAIKNKQKLGWEFLTTDTTYSGQVVAVVDKYFKKSSVDNIGKSSIININLQYFAKIPEEKFTDYALNPIKSPEKAKAFMDALGYNLDNCDELINNIKSHIEESKFVEKGDNGYGMRYEYVMNITGANGKSANVLTAWIQDGEEKRLTSVYVTNKKVTK